MKLNPLKKNCVWGNVCFLILILGCAGNQSSPDLGYYYIDEEEAENVKTPETEKNQTIEKKQNDKSSAEELGFYYIEDEEPTKPEPQSTTKQPAAAPTSNQNVSKTPVADNTTQGTQNEESSSNAEFGKASYYGDKFHGRPTASGEPYDRDKLTAAHRTHPFGTICRVTNTANGKSVEVRVNDRGPHVKSRVIDLSYKAMSIIDGISAGIINVKVEVVK